MPRQTTKKIVFFCLAMGSDTQTDQMAVSRYTQTREKWLRAKIVKFGHDRHYKETIAVYRKRGTTSTTVLEILKPRNRKQGLRKRSRKKNIRRGKIRKEGKKKIES